MSPPETIIEKLRKIEALATSGINGERENAQRLLDSLCSKYHVDLAQLSKPDIEPRQFTVKNPIEAKLLHSSVAYVCQTYRCRNTTRGRKHYFWLTMAQAIDVQECFEHHRKPFAQHIEDATAAYLFRNNLHAPTVETPEPELTDEVRERAKRIAAMMLFMNSTQWRKSILAIHAPT